VRYLWRGAVSLRLRNVDATLATVVSPHISEDDPRLRLTAATLSISVAAGRMDATATSMAAIAYARPAGAGARSLARRHALAAGRSRRWPPCLSAAAATTLPSPPSFVLLLFRPKLGTLPNPLKPSKPS
jgi:hypothetical protein